LSLRVILTPREGTGEWIGLSVRENLSAFMVRSVLREGSLWVFANGSLDTYRKGNSNAGSDGGKELSVRARRRNHPKVIARAEMSMEEVLIFAGKLYKKSLRSVGNVPSTESWLNLISTDACLPEQ